MIINLSVHDEICTARLLQLASDHEEEILHNNI